MYFGDGLRYVDKIFQKIFWKFRKKYWQINLFLVLLMCPEEDTKNAGIAQLIERRLAKAKVASLSLVSRSSKDNTMHLIHI